LLLLVLRWGSCTGHWCCARQTCAYAARCYLCFRWCCREAPALGTGVAQDRLLLVLLLGALVPLDPCARAASCCLSCFWCCAGASVMKKIEEIQEEKRANEVSETAIFLLKRVFCRGSIYTNLTFYASLVRGGAAFVFVGFDLGQLQWALALRKAALRLCGEVLLVLLLVLPWGSYTGHWRCARQAAASVVTRCAGAAGPLRSCGKVLLELLLVLRWCLCNEEN
jgi:hypothetical protein